MSHLKRNNVSKCFSLLREFVEESKMEDNKKDIAVMTIDQLQRTIAGTVNITMLGCVGRPIADRS